MFIKINLNFSVKKVCHMLIHTRTYFVLCVYIVCLVYIVRKDLNRNLDYIELMIFAYCFINRGVESFISVNHFEYLWTC